MHILFVSPRFPPTSAADSQRLRMLLPHMEAAGCTVEVLAVEPSQVAAPLDTWQARHLPGGVPIHRVRGLSLRWSRIPGLGLLESRSFAALAAAGDALLRQRHFDLVYLSTTAFGTFALGPRWRQRAGVPFVLDYQDPWVNDHYRLHPELPPPGGRLKHAVVDRLHRIQEPRVLRHCSGYTSVSAAYPEQIRARYPFAAALPCEVLPFPGSIEDFDHLDAIERSRLPFDPDDGNLHWVSIGRGGEDLQQAVSGLFLGIARDAPADLKRRLRLHFLGTSYAASGRGVASIAPLAARYGLESIVEEVTDRLPLSLALATLRAADALLVIGSNDPGYTASKIAPYLLARRPLLAVMHERSPALELLRDCGGGVAIPFGANTAQDVLARRIGKAWLAGDRYTRTIPLDPLAFEPHTAAGQARILTQFFRRCLQP